MIAKLEGENFKVGILEKVEKLVRPVAAWRKTGRSGLVGPRESGVALGVW